MTDRYQTIYRQHADAYDELIKAEDCDGHLLPAILQLTPVAGQRVLDIGAGTGRLTRLLLGAGAAHVIALDQSAAMLKVASQHLSREHPDPERWQLVCGDASSLPFGDGRFDLVVAGWVFGHTTSWHPTTWRDEITTMLAEIQRVLTRPGTALIFETMGTASETPGPPNDALAAYYNLLEQRGMAHTLLRTDYRFLDVETAARVCGNFFGEAREARIRASGSNRVHEWTGIWSKTFPAK